MSLFENNYIDAIRINTTDRPDGRGGQITDYVEDMHIKCAIMFNDSIQTRIAMEQGVTSVYIITCPVGTKLKFNEIIKRVSDNQYFRIMSNSEEKHPPKNSSIKFEQATAELWKMP